MLSAPDYLDDSVENERHRRREAQRLRRGSVIDQALRSTLQPNRDFYDAAAVLTFEAEHPDPGGRKSELIRRRFRCTETRYYQRLYHLIYDDEANSRRIDAATVNRLQRGFAERAETRRQRTPET